MIKKLNYLITALAILLLCSCSKELDYEQNAPSSDTSFNSIYRAGSDYSDQKVCVDLTPGDRILLEQLQSEFSNIPGFVPTLVQSNTTHGKLLWDASIIYQDNGDTHYSIPFYKDGQRETKAYLKVVDSPNGKYIDVFEIDAYDTDQSSQLGIFDEGYKSFFKVFDYKISEAANGPYNTPSTPVGTDPNGTIISLSSDWSPNDGNGNDGPSHGCEKKVSIRDFSYEIYVPGYSCPGAPDYIPEEFILIEYQLIFEYLDCDHGDNSDGVIVGGNGGIWYSDDYYKALKKSLISDIMDNMPPPPNTQDDLKVWAYLFNQYLSNDADCTNYLVHMSNNMRFAELNSTVHLYAIIGTYARLADLIYSGANDCEDVLSHFINIYYFYNSISADQLLWIESQTTIHQLIIDKLNSLASPIFGDPTNPATISYVCTQQAAQFLAQNQALNLSIELATSILNNCSTGQSFYTFLDNGPGMYVSDGSDSEIYLKTLKMIQLMDLAETNINFALSNSTFLLDNSKYINTFKNHFIANPNSTKANDVIALMKDYNLNGLNAGDDLEWLLEQSDATILELNNFLDETEIAGDLEYATSSIHIYAGLDKQNLWDVPFNNQSIDNLLTINTPDGDVILDATLIKILAEILKKEHPSWSIIKCYWEAGKVIKKATIHLELDILGMTEPLGAIFDLANGILYTLEGDTYNASFTFIAMVPGPAGWTATAAKWAKRIIPGTRFRLVWKFADGKIKYAKNGSLRSQLRRILNTPTGFKAHHVIPLEHKTHVILERAAKAVDNTWHPNRILNGANIENFRHTGSHPQYSALIGIELDKIPNNLSLDDTVLAVDALMTRIRTAIDAAPNTLINDIQF